MEMSRQLSYTEALKVLLFFLDEKSVIFTLWQSKWNSDLRFTIDAVGHFCRVSRRHKLYYTQLRGEKQQRGGEALCPLHP